MLGVVLAGVLAGCSLGGGSGAGSTSGTLPDGIVKGRVVTTACGGPAASSCELQVYRGSLAFCPTMNSSGPCPSARVDRTGRYSITLRPGRHYLIPASGSGNVVVVKPRWVAVRSGQTTTVNINGGNLMK
jgi:hypothetical protein